MVYILSQYLIDSKTFQGRNCPVVFYKCVIEKVSCHIIRSTVVARQRKGLGTQTSRCALGLPASDSCQESCRESLGLWPNMLSILVKVNH